MANRHATSDVPPEWQGLPDFLLDELEEGACECGMPTESRRMAESDLNGRRTPEVLTDEHKDGSLWINHNDEIWAWVHGDWRMLRNSGLWSGIGLYSGESQMRVAGPFTEVDFAKLA